MFLTSRIRRVFSRFSLMSSLMDDGSPAIFSGTLASLSALPPRLPPFPLVVGLGGRREPGDLLGDLGQLVGDPLLLLRLSQTLLERLELALLLVVPEGVLDGVDLLLGLHLEGLLLVVGVQLVEHLLPD